MKPVIFYSVITFPYTKCFVHSYTVDVDFTLSYKHEQGILCTDFSDHYAIFHLTDNISHDKGTECIETN